jgi:hypothetical protein
MAKSRPRLDLEGRIEEGLRAAQANPASYGNNPFTDPFSTQEERDNWLQGSPSVDREKYLSNRPGDTGWIGVGSTRVKEIRFVPDTADIFSTGTLYVRFIKYDTAYAYRGVGRPQADQVNTMGQAGKGIGSYINAVLDNFQRDYCSQDELNVFFGGYGGTYRGPGG